MARLASLSVGITADTAAAEKAIEKNVSGAGLKAGQEAGRSASRSFVGALDSTAVKVGAAAIGALAAREIGKAISAASAISEAQNKVNTIFQDGADDVREFAESAAQSIGQSKIAVFDAAGTFGTFGKSAGLAGKDLAAFAERFTGLSSDLASFYDASPEDAVLALGAAMRGEAEPARQFGILLDDATLRQEALAQGLIKTTKEALTPQQKVLAASEAIWKQTADAQGDFARTSDGLANQQRILTAEFENTRAEVGEAFLPIALKATEWARGALAAFTALPEPLQAGALAVGVLGAGLVLVIPRTYATVVALKAMSAEMTVAKGKAIALNTALGLVGIAATAVVVVAVNEWSNFRAAIDGARDALENFRKEASGETYAALVESAEAARTKMEEVNDTGLSLGNVLRDVGLGFGVLSRGILDNDWSNQFIEGNNAARDAAAAVEFFDSAVAAAAKETGVAEEAVRSVAAEMYDSSQSWLYNAGAITKVVDAQYNGTKSGASLAKATEAAADAAADATEKTDALKSALDALNGVTLSENAAQRGYQAALDGVAGSIKENGRTLDVNSEKGRANAEVLDSIAQAALDYGQAIIETDGNNRRAIGTLGDSREALFKQARQFFKTDEATQAYVDSVLSIPEEWTTDVDINTEEATRVLDSFVKEFNGKKIKFYATTSGTISQYLINPKYLPGNANGGFARAGEPTLVGEAGVEVFTPDRDGYIVPNYAVREAMGSSSSSGGVTTANVRVYIGERELTDIVRVEVNERDEQMALALAGAR